MKFTSGTIESLDESLDTVTLYHGDKVVYKATYTKLESADLYCKFNNLKYIKYETILQKKRGRDIALNRNDNGRGRAYNLRCITNYKT